MTIVEGDTGVLVIDPLIVSMPRASEGSTLLAEASPTVSFSTAAGYVASRGERRVAVPDDIRSSFRGSALYLRAVDPASGEVFATVRALK